MAYRLQGARTQEPPEFPEPARGASTRAHGKNGAEMARIDSILSIVVSQGANELRVGTDREPKMLAHGAPKRLAIPVMGDDTLRHLMGELLTTEREEAMRAKGRVELIYDAPSLGTFQVTLAARASGDAGFDAVFLRSTARAAPRGGRGAPGPVVESVGESTHGEPPANEGAVLAAHASPSSDRPPVRDAAARSRGERSPGAALAALLARAAEARASDVHLMDAESPSLRVDGRLRPLDDEPHVDVSALLGDLLGVEARARIDRGESADLAFEIDGVGRFRLNAYRSAAGLAAAVRLLARSAPTLAALHLPVPLEEILDVPHGLVIVCGPTGSGKTTTLAALAQEVLRKRSVMLLTLEDPIEYVLAPRAAGSLVRQRQIGRDVRDFPTGLRDALREDPDVLLIGEMRDPATISLALTAAETGHLVLTSLHSRGTASAVERIVDAYPPERQQQIRVQLADALQAVVAQRLVPRARGGGRTPALEVLRVTHSVASVIRDGKTAQIASALQSGRREGMIALERCLADLVQTAQITIEDARAVANEPASLATYLGR
jgi:twitching motility protein PilT